MMIYENSHFNLQHFIKNLQAQVVTTMQVYYLSASVCVASKKQYEALIWWMRSEAKLCPEKPCVNGSRVKQASRKMRL